MDHRGHRGTQRKTNIFIVFYAFSAVKTGNGGGKQWELNRKEHKERKEGAAEQVRRLDLGKTRDRARPVVVQAWGAEPGIRTGCVGLVNELPNGIGFHPRPYHF